MVLVSDKPNNDIGISQTHTVGYEAGVSQQGQAAGHRT
jgi:hypothetical protein